MLLKWSLGGKAQIGLLIPSAVSCKHIEQDKNHESLRIFLITRIFNKYDYNPEKTISVIGAIIDKKLCTKIQKYY